MDSAESSNVPADVNVSFNPNFVSFPFNDRLDKINAKLETLESYLIPKLSTYIVPPQSQQRAKNFALAADILSGQQLCVNCDLTPANFPTYITLKIRVLVPLGASMYIKKQDLMGVVEALTAYSYQYQFDCFQEMEDLLFKMGTCIRDFRATLQSMYSEGILTALTLLGRNITWGSQPGWRMCGLLDGMCLVRNISAYYFTGWQCLEEAPEHVNSK